MSELLKLYRDAQKPYEKLIQYCATAPVGPAIYYDMLLDRYSEADQIFVKRVLELEAESTTLTTRIAELEAERRWIPVSERLPDAYEKVIALAKDCMNVDWVLPKELREVGKGAFARLYNVTHWMPLPKLPEVQE